MTIAITSVQTIVANPTLPTKKLLELVRKVHPGRSSENSIAWYKVHIKHEMAGEDNKLSKDLRKLVKNQDQLALDI